jgi:hypothetical protein
MSNYVWTYSGTFQEDYFIINGSTASRKKIRWDTPGDKTVTVSYTDSANGCTTTTASTTSFFGGYGGNFQLPILASNANPECGSTVTYTIDFSTTSVPADQQANFFDWNINTLSGNNIISGGGNNDDFITIQWLDTDFYFVDCFIDLVYPTHNNLSCFANASTNIMVENNIDASVTLSSNTITANNTNPGVTYQWVDCNNSNSPIATETNQSFTAAANGSYAVIVTENSCSATSVCSVISTLGLESNNFENTILVYPNPFSENITLKLGKGYSKININIKNVLGQIIQKKSYNNLSIINFDIIGSTGMYFIEIINERNETANFKILKE